MTEPSVPTSFSSNPRRAARKPLLLALAGGVAVCALAAGGYGYFYDDDTRLRRAHRVAWELEHGPLPEDVALMHTCDNPACVRVSHLVPGDQAANLADMRQKGRGFVPPPERGTERYTATLTDDVVRRLRRAYDSGKPIAPLARELGVRQSTAQRAATRQSWKHVTD